jgi:hypothetical protein
VEGRVAVAALRIEIPAEAPAPRQPP